MTQIKLVCYLTRKRLKSDSLVQNVCMFLQLKTSHCRDIWCWVSRNPSMVFLAASFTQKMPESSYSSIFMLENLWCHIFTWNGPNSQETKSFVPVMGHPGSELNWNKIHNLQDSMKIHCKLDEKVLENSALNFNVTLTSHIKRRAK